MPRISRVFQAAVLLLTLADAATPQPPPAFVSDPFQQRVGGVELSDQSVVDGVVMLSHISRLAVSVEHQLGPTISGTAPQPKTFTAKVGPGTVSEVLDGLCALDEAFTWARNGNMVNVFPRVLARDPHYFLNRTIDELTLTDMPGAEEAVFKTVEQLPGPKEQIAIMQVGTSVSFASPWSTTLQGASVREVFDLIARQLGPTYGWQLTGAEDFRLIIFHQGLSPNPSRSDRKQQTSGAR
jgi:hypothetical protein